jgi:dTDP-4-dehydrorhamnose 3,5-epimerase
MDKSRVEVIEGIEIVPIKISFDDRGTFIKFHPMSLFSNTLDSIALSQNPILGTIRGLHFQTEPFAEEKLVTCIQGSIFDVAVDLRPHSKTLGKWTSFILNSDNYVQAYLPKGIAHGFQTLQPNTIVHYGLSAAYNPDSSFSIDPLGELAINWPISEIVVSQRDRQGLSILSALQKYRDSLMWPQP